ncbi:transcription termination factor Rho [Mycobacterium persicum]|uniref:Transcription termination factor Rho n=1 Tax=Mycobacterium persicum TaxID=1487726 RepID=A0A8E2IPR9_9MYCO|nr:transcription termination factor Rho [Mycobacterium persicum]ORC06338.1 transcription termination factor Rho [Mycobacterium persicum]
MTDTDLITASESTGAEKQPESVTKDTSGVNTVAPGGSLSTMVLPELRALANRAGVKGTSGMRKNELIAAIQEITGQANGASAGSTSSQDSDRSEPTMTAKAAAGEEAPAEGRSNSGETQRRERRKSSREADTSATESGDQAAAGEDAATTDEDAKGRPGQGGARTDERGARTDERGARTDERGARTDERGAKTDEREESGGEQQGSGGQARGDEDGEGRQGRRGRRFRDRRRRGERSGEGAEAEVREDDVLQPVAGILDVLDNYAFVRTSGYLAGPHDVYVSMNMVRKNGLRRGDAVTGAVRVPREGEAGDKNPRQKFNPLVRLDSVNGGSVEDAKKRPDFSKLTPLYPNQRLRLETTPDRLTTRVIDLIMPIGKGQRALIVSPPKAGKTTILQDIANAITRNNPECHLMVVLVDERPEEVTDMQRSVKGEVIASTFDRPPSDHTSVAELAIERAKRLVEQGKDVVVLLDSITRLGRAYNNASPASGRILSGGVDSTALYPPKRFLGAARNIEEGGSLTIIATAMVETGSTGDTVIFEEFKGTGNAELKLDRKISERRVFPAVDVNPSGTRKDELLLSPDEFAIVHKLRRVLSGLDAHQAIDLLMSQLRKTKNNYEFLVQVSKTTPGNMDND